MYCAIISIPESSNVNDIHKIIHRVFSDPSDAGARCPRYVRIGSDAVQAFSDVPPEHPELAVSTYCANVPTGAVQLIADIAVARKVDGRRKSFERGKERQGARGIVERQLAKHGLAAGEFSYRFAGIVRDPDHRVTLPHAIVTVDVECDDPAVLDRICVDGWGDGRYLGLGAVRVVQR